MTIVVSGYALSINSFAGPVVFGLTIKTPITAQALANSSIEQWYAVDMRIKRRRPVTAEEWRLLRQFIEVRNRVRKKYITDNRDIARLNMTFSRSLTGTPVHADSTQGIIRLPTRGDPSGLQPVIRREPTRQARSRRFSAPVQPATRVRRGH